MAVKKDNRYSRIVEEIFFSKYHKGMTDVDFEREDLTKIAKKLRIELPKNLGDVIYSVRYRTPLPEKIVKTAPAGKAWVIKGTGKSSYRFVLIQDRPVTPNSNLAETKIPDSTPGIIAKYALSDEQALLAKVRYNRLIDIFTGVTCYSLQNHLRTLVTTIGQVETDELYVGIDKKGVQYVFPVQAKGGKDRIGIVQIEQDVEVCNSKFPGLVCRPIATQFMVDGVIALFEFEISDDRELRVSSEKHYRLVQPDDVTEKDLLTYKNRPAD